MQSIMDFVNSFGKSKLIIILVVLIALIIAFFVYRSMKLKKYRKEVLELDGEINSIKSMPIQYRLGRVKKIALNDEGLVEKYEQFLERNDALNTLLKEEVAFAINEIDEQLYFRRLSKVKGKLVSLKLLVEKYKKDATELLADIETITEIENEQRVVIIKLKEKYRELAANFENVKYKIDEYVPAVGESLVTLEQEFSELEEMMNAQLYAEANEKCAKLTETIDFLAVNVRDLPTYVSISRNYIPKRFSEITKRMESMNENGFCLERLNATTRFNKMQMELESALKDMQDLKIEAVGSTLEVITTEINELMKDFEQEEAAHNEYLTIWKDIFNKISEVHEDYKYAITEYKKLHERYIIEDLHLDIEQSYPELEIILDETKSLEHLIQSKDFSYAVVVERLKDLLAKSEKYEDTLRYFFSKRDELYLTEQRAIDELDNVNIVLLEIKSEIKNTHLPSISEKYIDYIDEAYERANAIQILRNSLPIDLNVLTKQADEARDIIYQLYENVHNLVITADMVEETIVYGNRYRSAFLEVNTELTKAELLFRNGEYSEALKIAVDIVEKIQPGFNERLTTKSVKNPTL
ncbi:MAG: septation ring formation regulator EzrA [Beduini sp.]|uniref:septation ring formation regulator EzrA n=1 Tax=Beduini sp. TaxID=1922300 RepID=UPI0011C94739